jgi:ribosomal protein S1
MESESGDSLDREVAAALEGVRLQELDERSGRAARGARRPGDRVQRGGQELIYGTVQGLSGDDVIVELGPTMQGVIALAEFETPPAIGLSFEFTLHGQEDGLWLLSRRGARQLAAWDQLAVGGTCKAEVVGINAGGLELKVGPLSAFMPASQVALHRIEDLSSLLGQTLVCEVLELSSERQRVVLSRRAVLEREREEGRREALGRLTPGSTLTGTVTRIEPFGAFVDVGGGVEGLVHVSNVARRRVQHPEEVLAVGQEVRALVLEVKEGGRRISLGIKQLEPDPWDGARAKYPDGALLTGTVTRLSDFGAFVELEPGLEGLVHVSQLASHRVANPREAVESGETVSVRVLAVDPNARRISLSRLDERGALLGSEEAADGETIEQVVRASSAQRATTNLGSLFKKALGER